MGKTLSLAQDSSVWKRHHFMVPGATLVYSCRARPSFLSCVWVHTRGLSHFAEGDGKCTESFSAKSQQYENAITIMGFDTPRAQDKFVAAV